jgi:hypothetical protein
LCSRLENIGPIVYESTSISRQGGFDIWVQCPADLSLLVEKSLRLIDRLDWIENEVHFQEVITQTTSPPDELIRSWIES